MKTDEKKTLLIVQCPKSLFDNFQKNCSEKAQTMSSILRRLMLEFVEKEEKK